MPSAAPAAALRSTASESGVMSPARPAAPPTRGRRGARRPGCCATPGASALQAPHTRCACAGDLGCRPRWPACGSNASPVPDTRNRYGSPSGERMRTDIQVDGAFTLVAQAREPARPARRVFARIRLEDRPSRSRPSAGARAAPCRGRSRVPPRVRGCALPALAKPRPCAAVRVRSARTRAGSTYASSSATRPKRTPATRRPSTSSGGRRVAVRTRANNVTARPAGWRFGAAEPAGMWPLRLDGLGRRAVAAHGRTAHSVIASGRSSNARCVINRLRSSLRAFSVVSIAR